MGEVGLAGEIRPVTGVPRRLAEAARLGFRTAIVPRDGLGSAPAPDGMRVVEAADLASALASTMRHQP
jgi:DNA repair protein RadA/Sms